MKMKKTTKTVLIPALSLSLLVPSIAGAAKASAAEPAKPSAETGQLLALQIVVEIRNSSGRSPSPQV